MKKFLFFLFLSQLCFSQKWSISFAERTALINIYNSTSGDQWSQKWDLEKDPKNWYGVKVKNGNITEINLRGNALKGNFPTILGFSKIERLDLSSNQLSGEISPSVASLSNLVGLDISNNRLTGDPTAKILPLSNLSELSIGNNNFTFGDINTFLQNFSALKVLDLSNMALTAVPQKISSLPNLEVLNLSNNTLSQNFGNLSSLTKLSDLNLSGNQLTKIPSEIGLITSLRTLDLSNNQFFANYSTALANLKNLEWLSLQNNQIDAFPAELSQLKNLVHLNVSDNKISGGFESLLILKNLQQIYLDKNLISGNFPSALLQLEKLQMLSLTGNKISGEIPENIPPLTFLENNRFTKLDIKNFIEKEKKLADFTYSPQRYDEPKTVFASLGNATSLSQALSGDDYEFAWYKNLDQKTQVTTETYHISNVSDEDFSTYTCEAYVFEELPTELMEISFFREPVTLVKNLGTEEIAIGLSVYPNPATDFINIKTNKIKIEKVFIFDLSGKLLFTTSAQRINISHLPSATYILSVKTADNLKSFKFIKL